MAASKPIVGDKRRIHPRLQSMGEAERNECLDAIEDYCRHYGVCHRLVVELRCVPTIARALPEASESRSVDLIDESTR